ncbi:MAG: MATE family efflux transporter [Bacteroides sp.]|nr:MATE family efflux transporter [Prevotella sp.]MCM1408059.1 MATE family efflux transporter [Treponema brennaborense]MCM1469035.1 MATE family efflux transporter [Bacteroides sp.]
MEIDMQKRMFSGRDLWQLIWPLVVEQFLAITLGIADIIMVGSLGEAAVSGVSLVDAIFVLLNQVFAALATGGTVVCAQYLGKGDQKMASKTARQLIYVVIGIAVFLMCAGFPLHTAVLKGIFGNIEADVMANAREYFLYMLAGLPSVGLYNACAALFRSQRNSKISMLTALLVNVINIGGNALMLYVLHFGVAGVAIPTFAARTAAAVVLLVLLRGKNTSNRSHSAAAAPRADAQIISIAGLHKVELDMPLVKRILKIGIPNGLENSMFQIGKLLVMSLTASFGTSAIAANAAANTFASFEVLPASSIGLAMLTVVGQCVGASRYDEAVYYTKKLMAAAYLSMAVLNIPLLLCSKLLLGTYGLSEEATRLGYKMLMVHGLCAMAIWPCSFTLPAALRASNDAKYTMIVSMISMWSMRVGMSYVFAAVTNLGALGVWWSMVIDWLFRSILFCGRFRGGKWKQRKLI